MYNGAETEPCLGIGNDITIKEASLEMVPGADVGDYVLVHVGVAISKVNEEEANKVFGYLREAGELDELYDPTL